VLRITAPYAFPMTFSYTPNHNAKVLSIISNHSESIKKH
jgi:hypothetical protein